MNVQRIAIYAAIGAAAVAGLALWSRMSSASAPTGGSLLDAINPTSPDNLAYRGVSAVVSAVTGTPDSLGTWLAEKFDPATRRVNEMLAVPARMTGDAFRRLSDETFARDDAEVFPWVLDSGPAFDAWERDMVN